MWAQIINAILGVWLMAAPDVLDYTGFARTNDRIIGPLAFSFALVAIWEVTRPVRWINLLLGMWLLLAPLLLRYPELEATSNSMVVGLLLAILALIRGQVQQQFGGGWASLWRSTETHWGQDRANDSKGNRAEAETSACENGEGCC